ncbi:MAG: hypothetical protein M3Z84_02290, partial [Actinomycetota bacterium]|nr:hypothetical protein [Actinomycetota bacterium]
MIHAPPAWPIGRTDGRSLKVAPPRAEDEQDYDWDRGGLVIDVDRFEEQLDLALTDELRSAIGLATANPPAPAAVANDIPSLLRAGRTQDADEIIADHRAAAAGPTGTASDRRDAAIWSTMQALRDGRAEDARAGTLTVRALSQEAGDPRADDRY